MAKRRKRKYILRTKLPQTSWRLLNQGEPVGKLSVREKLESAEKAIYLANQLKSMGEHKPANALIKFATKLINQL